MLRAHLGCQIQLPITKRNNRIVTASATIAATTTNNKDDIKILHHSTIFIHNVSSLWQEVILGVLVAVHVAGRWLEGFESPGFAPPKTCELHWRGTQGWQLRVIQVIHCERLGQSIVCSKKTEPRIESGKGYQTI